MYPLEVTSSGLVPQAHAFVGPQGVLPSQQDIPMSDTSLPITTNPSTPSGPLVPQGIAGTLQEAVEKAIAQDILLEALQDDPALDPTLVQPVKDARNVVRESGFIREGFQNGGLNGEQIP